MTYRPDIYITSDAEGDGVTDDTAALQASIDEAATSKKPLVLGPNKTYNISAGPGLNISGIELIMLDNTVITAASGSTSNFPNGATAAVYASGTLGESIATITSASQHSTVVTASIENHGIVTGENVFLYDPTDYSYNLSRANYRNGEINTVVSVSGSLLFMETPLRSGYNSTTQIFKPTFAKASVKGGKIIGLSNTAQWAAIRFDICKGSRLENLEVELSQASIASFKRCFDCEAINLKGINDSTPAGLNYVLGIANSQKIKVERCTLRASRHAITIGGGDYDGAIVNRDIEVSNCHLSTDGEGGVATADCHGNSESIIWSNNFIHGGLNIGGNEITVDHCHVWAEPTNGLGIQFSEPNGFNYKISNSNFYATSNTDNNALIYYDQSAPVTPLGSDKMMFSNCLFDMKEHDGNMVLIRNRTGTDTKKVSFDNCTFKRKADYATQGVVQIAGLNSVDKTLESVTISNCHFIGASCYVTDVMGTVKITDTLVEKGNQRGFSVTNGFAGSSNEHVAKPLVIIDGCTAIDCGNTGFYLDGVGTGYGTIKLSNWNSYRNGRTSSGSSADLAAVYLGNVNRASVLNGHYGDDQDSKTQIRGFVYSNIGHLEQDNNVFIESGSVPTSIATNVSTFVRQTHGVKVEEFGAIGDGVTNDSTAINLAATRALEQGHGVVLFQGKDYLIQSKIVHKAGIVWKGEGRTKTRLIGDNLNGPIWGAPAPAYSTDSADRVIGGGIQGMTFDNSASSNASGVGIDLSQISYVFIDDITCNRVETGIRADHISYGNKISNFAVASCIDGVQIREGAREISFDHGRINSATNGFVIAQDTEDGVNGVRLNDVTIEAFSGIGVDIDCTTENAVDSVFMSRMRYEGGSVGISIDGPVGRIEDVMPHVTGVTYLSGSDIGRLNFRQRDLGQKEGRKRSVSKTVTTSDDSVTLLGNVTAVNQGESYWIDGIIFGHTDDKSIIYRRRIKSLATNPSGSIQFIGSEQDDPTNSTSRLVGGTTTVASLTNSGNTARFVVTGEDSTDMTWHGVFDVIPLNNDNY